MRIEKCEYRKCNKMVERRGTRRYCCKLHRDKEHNERRREGKPREELLDSLFYPPPVIDREFSSTADMMLVAAMVGGEDLRLWAATFGRSLKAVTRRVNDLRRSGDYESHKQQIAYTVRYTTDTYAARLGR